MFTVVLKAACYMTVSLSPNRIANCAAFCLQTCFDDVIAEPEGAHSADCVWRNAFRCFRTGKSCCYRCATLVCAVPLAFIWGCEFACVAFTHIWVVTPCFRMCDLNFDCCRKFWSLCVHCVLDPCYEAVALVFSKIFITHTSRDSSQRDSDVERSPMLEHKSFRRSGRSNRSFIPD